MVLPLPFFGRKASLTNNEYILHDGTPFQPSHMEFSAVDPVSPPPSSKTKDLPPSTIEKSYTANEILIAIIEQIAQLESGTADEEFTPEQNLQSKLKDMYEHLKKNVNEPKQTWPNTAPPGLADNASEDDDLLVGNGIHGTGDANMLTIQRHAEAKGRRNDSKGNLSASKTGAVIAMLLPRMLLPDTSRDPDAAARLVRMRQES
ncbi:hypothetical protein NA57DRAFT_78899 [Rhizodiscina lignyota]|uniref:Uncharacterized protein n=1 Tax=Rhizodiscina lignyota TaxID=1504668 RepID=A0A9P4I6M9_9PEZI|nr:hypothetical protein NA57DRAFT_78899 [Rhizodiscina lignyota]